MDRMKLIELVVEYLKATNELDRARLRRKIEMLRTNGIDFASEEMQAAWAKWSRL